MDSTLSTYYCSCSLLPWHQSNVSRYLFLEPNQIESRSFWFSLSLNWIGIWIWNGFHSLLFSLFFPRLPHIRSLPRLDTHTHTHKHIYMYIYACFWCYCIILYSIIIIMLVNKLIIIQIKIKQNGFSSLIGRTDTHLPCLYINTYLRLPFMNYLPQLNFIRLHPLIGIIKNKQKQ